MAYLTLLSVCMFPATAFTEEPLTNKIEMGPVTATVTLEPTQPVIGDTLNLTIEVQAEKGVELLMPEFGEALETFSIVDFVPRETIDDEGAHDRHAKVSTATAHVRQSRYPADLGRVC